MEDVHRHTGADHCIRRSSCIRHDSVLYLQLWGGVSAHLLATADVQLCLSSIQHRCLYESNYTADVLLRSSLVARAGTSAARDRQAESAFYPSQVSMDSNQRAGPTFASGIADMSCSFSQSLCFQTSCSRKSLLITPSCFHIHCMNTLPWASLHCYLPR
jgi:hypothetical protein